MTNTIDNKIVDTLRTKMGHLPEDIVDIYETFDWVDTIIDIGEGLHLNTTEIEDIIIATGLVLSEEARPDDLPGILSESFKDEQILGIMEAVVERVLSPVQDLVIELFENNGVAIGHKWLIPEKSPKLLFRDGDMLEEPLTEEEKKIHAGLEFESYTGDTPDFFSAIASHKGNNQGLLIAERREQRRRIEREAQRAFGQDLELAERNLRQELIQVEKNAPRGISDLDQLEDELTALDESEKIKSINEEIHLIKQQRIDFAHDDSVDHEELQRTQKMLITELQRTQATIENQKKALLDHIDKVKEHSYLIEEKKLVLKKLLDYKAKIESIK